MKTLEDRWYHYKAMYVWGGVLRKFAERRYFFTQIVHACDIPLQIKIGQNIKFGHRGIGIVIHKDTIIGDNVHIMQNVTIGAKEGAAPIIGNNVLIGAGAVILGNVTIGDDSIVGANAVVTKNVEKGSVVYGIPAIKKANKDMGEK